MTLPPPVMTAEIVVSVYRVLTCRPALPPICDSYRQHAVLAEELELEADQPVSFFAVGWQAEVWPALVVAQQCNPAGFGFDPGIVPETDTVFIGAGERLLAYSLEPIVSRLWVDSADVGFWRWRQHGDLVLMSAELELAAWTSGGVKLWSTFVELPWDYSVSDGIVALDVMGTKSSFPIAGGPRAR